VGGSTVAAQEPPPGYSDWEQVLQSYLLDPVGNRDRVIALARQGVEGIPAVALVVIGDAYFRAGDLPNASRLFRAARAESEVVNEPEQSPWIAFSNMGLGMVDVAQGDMGGAYRSFSAAAAAGGPSTSMAMLGAAQSAAAIGKDEEALDLLSALDETEGAPGAIRDAARFARGEVLLRQGKYDEAAALFDEIAAGTKGGLASDASYAAARARLASGERETGRTALEAMLTACAEPGDGTDPRRTNRQLRELDARAVMQAWVENYREVSFEPYLAESGRGSVDGFSIDGCALRRPPRQPLRKNPLRRRRPLLRRRR
jgi:tetratricopeptide (TPR) repeat protein